MASLPTIAPDWVPSTTAVVDVFDRSYQAAMRGEQMYPRGPSDKEYFAQDWFQQRLVEIGRPWRLMGRNAYPDYWVDLGGVREGYEVKSLAVSAQGRPARSDFDSNSAIPAGVKEGSQVFVAFFLYTGAAGSPRVLHSLVLFHGDFLNDERELVHVNQPVRPFGAYGDAFIRDRKMYIFKTPYTIDGTCFGRIRLIVPTEWNLGDSRLRKVSTLTRNHAPQRLTKYAVHLYDRTVEVITEANPRAQLMRRFDVFEHA